ncbi:MAG: alpha/beta hydrolase, partial [Betaproteobacteria bacterium]|nr:alpha/beta hydrolase [Betaproteobacteria bacterium]
ADLQALCDALAAQGDARPLVGVFHSLSAVTSLRHLDRYGPRWDALVLVDPPLSPPPGHAMESDHAHEVQLLAEAALRRRPAFDSPQQLADRFARVAVFGVWQAQACMDMAVGTLRQVAGGGVWQLRCAPEREALVYRNNHWPLAQQVLANCPFPVHLLAADATMPGSGLPARYALDLHQSSVIGYTSIAGTGHFLQLEQPQACVHAIAQFVRQAGLFASASYKA